MSDAFRIPDMRPRKRQAFALTPLADVMFQLLIFFMLSTSLAPYALIPLAAPTAPADAAPSQVRPAQSGGSDARVIWHIAKGEIRAGDTTLSLEALPQVIEALKQDGLQEILLFTTPTATTQDIATVIEAIRLGEVARVRLIGRPGGG